VPYRGEAQAGFDLGAGHPVPVKRPDQGAETLPQNVFGAAPSVANIGRERVLASTDCGFGTFAGLGKVDADIAFKKLTSLVQGAALASKRLWT
jgi:hypothetical protein